MGRASTWNGVEWISMTGGAGEDEGGGTPDDTYLRLDGGNNPASPDDFIRSSYVDGVFMPLAGNSIKAGRIYFDQNSTDAVYFRRTDSTITNWYMGYNTIGQFALRNENGPKWLWDDSEAQAYEDLNMRNFVLYAPKDPFLGTHVGDRDYNDARYALSDPVQHARSSFSSASNIGSGIEVLSTPITLSGFRDVLIQYQIKIQAATSIGAVHFTVVPRQNGSNMSAQFQQNEMDYTEMVSADDDFIVISGMAWVALPGGSNTWTIWISKDGANAWNVVGGSMFITAYPT